MRNIPENNLAYPVLITLTSGHSGSGFQLNSGDEIFLVTAKHVLFDDKGNLLSNGAELTCQTYNLDDDTTTIYNVDFDTLNKSNLIFSHPDKDVAGFTLASVKREAGKKEFTTIPVTGVSLKQVGKSGIVTVAKKSVLFIKDILVSNDVFLYGYPSSLGIKRSPQFDYKKPLLRKGIVASVNKKQGTAILDCPVYYGNSGGPVVQVSLNGAGYDHKIIGVVSQFVPYTENWINQSNKLVHTEWSNSGYSVAVAMDYVFEMLKITL